MRAGQTGAACDVISELNVEVEDASRRSDSDLQIVSVEEVASCSEAAALVVDVRDGTAGVSEEIIADEV